MVVATSGHLEIGAPLEAGHAIIDAAPIGDNESFESPLIPQDIAQQLQLRDPEILVGSFDRPTVLPPGAAHAETSEKEAPTSVESARAANFFTGGKELVFCCRASC